MLTLYGGFLFAQRFNSAAAFFIAGPFMCFCYTTTSLIPFFLSRYCCKDCLHRNLVSKIRIFKAIDASFLRHGLKLVVLIRIAPAIPRNGQTYVLASTSCKVKDYILGTMLGILPGMLSFCYLGIDLKNLSEVIQGKTAFNPVEAVVLIITSIFIVIFSFIVAKEAKKQLKVILDEGNDHSIYNDLPVENSPEVKTDNEIGRPSINFENEIQKEPYDAENKD